MEIRLRDGDDIKFNKWEGKNPPHDRSLWTGKITKVINDRIVWLKRDFDGEIQAANSCNVEIMRLHKANK